MNAKFVVMGLPESGKTTFLAALWHLVEAGDTDCNLALDGYRGNLKYLNKISEAWRTFQHVPRTTYGEEVDVSIGLRNQKTGERGIAFFPDVAGEVFDRQVIERRCRSEFVDAVSADDGVLFFITANTYEDFLSLAELNARLGFAGTETPIDADQTQTAERNDESGNSGASPAGHGRAWRREDLPRQVKIVQILSDLQRSPFTQRRRRVAIMISAWDLARGMNMTPRDWLACHMPLVNQYLKTNNVYFEHEIYGVSAQGVDLRNADAVDAAAKLPQSSRRISIVGPEGDGHDLTLPLVWLMSAIK
ncbi:hypothetical protein Q1J55_04000 [Pseudomonas syringae]|uniref:TRAFAC clade GTPase domain-containing protein n=1 Tax=Pseudomonas TaxID=286 RepID=UPI00073C9C41|nr:MULTISPECIES: hypothetical protein [Pseudomonas]KTC09414.1 hypothetical protein AO387_08575 [Pseudomonas syringae ICMP 11168]MBP1086780.1 hypothetical protein [Pseudomonas sp. PvP007]MBP1141526.1 hypothetical protein [Pseudomonas sp. PvP009]MBP1192183.1 hypothetical protein [Pseudomonas sp. PvP100]MCF5653113.1 hypothetical protein [Pseudomonas syringae]